jgi:hypothetical protein
MAVSEGRVSRRGLLKRAGVGAAALGAGSMLTTSTASANAPASRICLTAGGCGVCAGQADCDGCDCSCVVTVEGCCFCHQPVFCTGIPTCTSSAGCPPGWVCARTCCFGGDPICVPHCGAVNHHTVPCTLGQLKPAGRSISAPL